MTIRNLLLLPGAGLALIACPLRAQNLVYQFDGENWSSIFGETSDAGRDVDGDLRPDLIVGGHRGMAARGIVKVFSGASGDLLHEFEGTSQAGHLVTLLDDLDGDGQAEFAFNNQFDVEVRSGASGNLLFTVANPTWVWLLAPFGDWNGDGVADLIGGDRVLSGVDGAELFDFGVPSTIDEMDVPGDLNGDGQPDLLTYRDAGMLFVARSGVDGSTLFQVTHTGLTQPSAFGGVGDVDADGRDDLGILISEPPRVEVRSGNGGGVLYTRLLDVTFNGVPTQTELLDSLGDVDGDGRDDILVGATPTLVLSGSTGCEITRLPAELVGMPLSVASAGDVQGDGVPDVLVGDPFAQSFWGRAAVYDIHERVVGVGYCVANSNSTGFEAHMCATGSRSIADNSLTLHASPVPVNSFMMFYGPNQVQVPFGAGWRCVGGGITRMFPPGIAFGGVAERVVDLAAEGIQPGILNFQCWIRDPMGSGPTFNLSDGYSIDFVP